MAGGVERLKLDHGLLVLVQLTGERLGLRDVPSLRSLVASEQHHVAVAELRVVDAVSRTDTDAHFAHPLPDPAHVATIAFEQAVEPRQYRCPTALIPQPLEPALEGRSGPDVGHVFYRRQCSDYKGHPVARIQRQARRNRDGCSTASAGGCGAGSTSRLAWSRHSSRSRRRSSIARSRSPSCSRSNAAVARRTATSASTVAW